MPFVHFTTALILFRSYSIWDCHSAFGSSETGSFLFCIFCLRNTSYSRGFSTFFHASIVESFKNSMYVSFWVLGLQYFCQSAPETQGILIFFKLFYSFTILQRPAVCFSRASDGVWLMHVLCKTILFRLSSASEFSRQDNRILLKRNLSRAHH